MHSHALHRWQHSHVFDQDRKRAGEARTLIVVALTAVTMVVEITTGVIFGSMALLADGLHGVTHNGTRNRCVCLCRFAPTGLRSPLHFWCGENKQPCGLCKCCDAARLRAVHGDESVTRLFNPLEIAFDQALVVAVLGLLVNGFSAWILMSTPSELGHGHDHGHSHGHGHADHHHHHDHNLRAAYLHVLADALTSLLAIVALLAGKFYGAAWLDRSWGSLVPCWSRWSYGLIMSSSRVLLDCDATTHAGDELRNAVEQDSTDRVADLHYWTIGHGIFACELTIVSHNPVSPEEYKSRIPAHLGVVHACIEVHRCDELDPPHSCDVTTGELASDAS